MTTPGEDDEPEPPEDEEPKPPEEEAEEERYAEERAAAESKYGPFLEANPGSWLQIVELGGGPRAVIYEPWNDPSIAIIAPKDDDSALAEALNSIFLPPRYTALHHRDLRKMEVIWTAYKLEQGQEQIQDRKFIFELEGVEHECTFARSSDRLLAIAKESMPLQMSSTDFRNLRSFATFANDREEEGLPSHGEPLSFWISEVDWDDDKILNLVRHLNFYLRYYDSESPVVQVHPVKPEIEINPKMRYFEGVGFPATISGRSLDPSLLVLWNAAFGTSRPGNFLNFYRIIEYVSYYYSHEKARQQVREIIKKPHALSDLDRTSRDVLFVLRELKYQREQDAVGDLIKVVVKPALLWKEVSQNTGFFSTATAFDGDLEIEALIGSKETEQSFGSAHVERFASSITKIRNALAHGKDTKTAKTILPTSRNFDLLQPWLHLIATVAGEVVLFDSTH